MCTRVSTSSCCCALFTSCETSCHVWCSLRTGADCRASVTSNTVLKFFHSMQVSAILMNFSIMMALCLGSCGVNTSLTTHLVVWDTEGGRGGANKQLILNTWATCSANTADSAGTYVCTYVHIGSIVCYAECIFQCLAIHYIDAYYKWVQLDGRLLYST